MELVYGNVGVVCNVIFILFLTRWKVFRRFYNLVKQDIKLFKLEIEKKIN